MNLYFAPLEGITGFTYRNAHAEMFGSCDAYFAPFINPSDNEKVSKKGIKDILPENNVGIPLKAQVLTNNSVSFLKFAEKVKAFGYDELNINLGCPSATVVRKGRGSGFLKEPDALDKFLYEIFEKSDLRISVKTRTGYFSGDEMEQLMEIYNKYPLTQLIIHPRAREDFYGGMPNNDVFEMAYNMSGNKLCYNGNIFTAAEYKRITERFPKLDGIMLGRGAIKNPALFREINGGEKLTSAELIEFSSRLADSYNKVLQSDVFTLHKLKEIWVYILWDYPDEKKTAKAIKKAKTLSEFMSAIRLLPEI